MGDHAMIELKRITDFGRSPPALEELLLLCAAYGTQGLYDTADALHLFLSTVHSREHLKGWQPFEGLRRLGKRDDLAEVMKNHGLRSHKKTARGIAAVVECGVDLRTCTVEELEAIPGITPSAARLFLLH